MEKIKCQNCEKEFQPKNLRAIYCSNSCKTLSYRKRKGIQEPEFLKKKQATMQRVQKNRMVMKRFDNQDYSQNELLLNSIISEIEKENSNKSSLLNEYSRIINKNEQIENAIAGALLGGIFGKKLEAAVIFGLIGSMVGASAKKDPNNINKKIARLKEIEQEVQALDTRINSLLFKKNEVVRVLNVIPRYINREIQESYFEYIPIESLKPIILPQKVVVTAQKENEVKNFIMSSNDLQNAKFETYRINDDYLNIFRSKLPIPSRIQVYGRPGQGKSTWAIDFAFYLADNLGRVLYNTAEEGFSETLQRKMNGRKSDYLDFGNFKTFEDLKRQLVTSKEKYAFLFIDSVSDMVITVSQLKEIIEQDPKRSVIYIMHATKMGDFKGKSEYKHLCDYEIKVENYIATCEKGR